MKTTIKILVTLCVFFVMSCRDTKKEEQTVKATEEIEAIEVETDSIVEDLEQDAKALEKEIDQLNIEN